MNQDTSQLTAPTAESYHVHRTTYAATGGGSAAGASYVLHGTLGQSSVTPSQGDGRIALGGIWRGVSAANVLVLEKEYRDEAAPVEAGDDLLFVVAATNNGYRVQEGVVVTDVLPAGLVLVPGSGEANVGVISTGTAHLGTLQTDVITLTVDRLTYDEIAVLTFRARVQPGYQGRTITNTATAASIAYGPIGASAVVRVADATTLYLPLIMLGYSPSGGHEVTPTPTPTPEVTEHDLDDAPDTCPGHFVQIDHTYYDDWDHANDNDWYSFDAARGRTYTIQTGDLHARADTTMVLYDANCLIQLAENDDANYPGEVWSQIVWTAPAGGRYHVMVRSYDWTVYGRSTGYSFGVLRGGTVGGGTGEGTQPRSAEPSKPPPLPTPTPIPDPADQSSARPPGKAAVLPQKPTPEPTPTPTATATPVPKPSPAPTPKSGSGSSGSGSGVAQSEPAPPEPTPAPVVLLPETGGRPAPGAALLFAVAGMLIAVGLLVGRDG